MHVGEVVVKPRGVSYNNLQEFVEISVFWKDLVFFMAVQAQHPSNALFLNRSGQEGKHMGEGAEFFLPQLKGILQPSHMVFGKGGAVGSRKRGREIESGLNLLQIQSQLQNQQHPGAISTGLRLAFEEEGNQHQKNQVEIGPSLSSSLLSEELARLVQSQKDEIDQFLQAQGEILRHTIAERRHRHHRVLVSAAKESLGRRLREKQAEFERLSRQNTELEVRMARVSVENQAWQARVREQEACIASLQAQLQQAMMREGIDELGCVKAESQAEDAESAHVDPCRFISPVPACRSCRRRSVSVVMLPCRHLCVCNECETVTDICPICRCVRSATVAVCLS